MKPPASVGHFGNTDTLEPEHIWNRIDTLGMGVWHWLQRTFKRDKSPKLKEQELWASKAGNWEFSLCSYKCFYFFSLCILQSKSQGSVFVRIHAPWQVLAREAEFLKIKVPTKKVCTCFSWVLGLLRAGCMRMIWERGHVDVAFMELKANLSPQGS